MSIQHVNVDGIIQLPAFSHATVAGDFIYVSGTLGTDPANNQVVAGGTGAETAQALRNIESILKACGATLNDLVKVNVFLTDISTFAEMNEAYVSVIGENPPARITVGRSAFALDAAVEIDAIAYKPQN